MVRKTLTYLLLVFLLIGTLAWPFVGGANLQAQESISSANSEKSQGEIDDLKKVIDELRSKIGQIQQEQRTLASTIKVLDSKILLNEKEIEKTQREINLLELQINELSTRIEGLELSLGELSEILVDRIQQQYKQSQLDPLSSLLMNAGLSGFIRDQRYLKQARAHTEDIMLATEYKRQVYDTQKSEKEAKQEEVQVLRNQLEGQRKQLAQQRADKQTLLQVTKNDEQTYQEKLAQALAEYQAIQSIVAGGGNESKVKDVKKGDAIASIIAGRSTCSTGAHLHFEVVKGGAHVNPAGFLKGESITWYDSSFGFSGSWDWPVNNPAIVTQGYGMTSFARSGFYGGSGHTGIDMLSKNSGDWGIKSVDDGELFRGSIKCGGGYLRYVRVKHNADVSTYYLHVNY